LKTNWMVWGALLVVGVVGCTTTQISLPPVTDTPTGHHDTGRIVWRDLITNKPAESRKFYRELFGWEFEGVGNLFGLGGEDAYSLIRHNGRLIGGMVNQNLLENRDGNVSQWVALMSVEDIDAAVSRFRDRGGEVLTPPTDVAQRGRMAVVVDPQGALLALVQTADGDPEWRQPDYGDFLWDELWTSDVEASTRFYAALADFSTRDVPAGDRDYRVLSLGDQPTAGVLAHPFEGERPVWVAYVRVEDPAAITSQVEALGGTVYLDARDRPLGGQVAVIADPSGAGIALQTWSFEQ
jgi:predicted enzyme related to lactoylglutathione lyase